MVFWNGRVPLDWYGLGRDSHYIGEELQAKLRALPGHSPSTEHPFEREPVPSSLPSVQKLYRDLSEIIRMPLMLPDREPSKKATAACYTCGKPTSQRCGRCKLAFACGPECFKLDWPLHKVNCGKNIRPLEKLQVRCSLDSLAQR